MSIEKKLKILKNTLGDSYTKGDESLFYCPRCEHHKKKLSVNIEKNVFKCWVCDWSGKNIYRIIRQYASQNDKFKWRSFHDEVEINNFKTDIFAKAEVLKQEVVLPKEFISLANKKLPSTSIKPLNYLQSRGISKLDIIKWKIGYCPTGKYASRIIIPSFDAQGDLNYFVSRTYAGEWKKYLNPKASRDIIFNRPYVNFDEDLVIVEGVFDAIRAGDNSVPLLGSTLNEKSSLFYEIVKNDTPVYLALDPDAESKASKIISLLLRYDIEVRKINVNPYDDVAEMPKSEYLQRKQLAELLDNDNYLLNKIRGI